MLLLQPICHQLSRLAVAGLVVLDLPREAKVPPEVISRWVLAGTTMEMKTLAFVIAVRPYVSIMRDARESYEIPAEQILYRKTFSDLSTRAPHDVARVLKVCLDMCEQSVQLHKISSANHPQKARLASFLLVAKEFSLEVASCIGVVQQQPVVQPPPTSVLGGVASAVVAVLSWPGFWATPLIPSPFEVECMDAFELLAEAIRRLEEGPPANANENPSDNDATLYSVEELKALEADFKALLEASRRTL